jgi:hypothetical protein
MLAILILVIAGFEEASNFNSWRSPQVVIPLVVAAPLLLAFLVYERQITIRDDVKEPVLPWRFCKNRVLSGILMLGFSISPILLPNLTSPEPPLLLVPCSQRSSFRFHCASKL